MIKKLLLLSLFALLPTLAIAWDQKPLLPLNACSAQIPYGIPVSSNQNMPVICRSAYILQYNQLAKLPIWVSYTLTPEHAIGCLPRSNAFETDRSIQNSATPQDFDASGYDKGHIAPDGDMSWNSQVELESFLMTNMTAQLPGLNRATWKLLETSIRDWAFQLNQPFTIYAGPIYNNTDKTIGNGVVVPHAFYKIVINDITGEVAGWIFPQANNLGTDLTRFRVSVVQIEQAVGIKFQFPNNARELNQNQMWPIDFGKMTEAKRQICHINQ